jgi:hypothetical protein
MDIIMPMSTTRRHRDLIQYLEGRLFSKIEKQELSVAQEQQALVYWGKNRKPSSYLVDINKIDDIQLFRNKIIYELSYVEPDLMVFKDNSFIENESGTKIAGYPDLIVEVWSESNEKEETGFKFSLYSTSPITEHWYIEQDSNEVECYFGNSRLPDQVLTNILKTQNGLEFDLRYLAIK